MNQELIEQFVAGRLDESQARAFEDYCVAHPEFAKQVEYEQRLRAGLAQVAKGSTAEFVRSNHSVRWKVAAGVGVLLSLFSIFYMWRAWAPKSGTPIMAAVVTDTQRSGPTMRLALVRGADAPPALAAGLIRVEIVGLFDLGAHYSVALDRLDKQKDIENLATLYSQHPSSPVTLEIMIDSDRLRAGAYTLRVSKQASSEEALDFGFVKL